VTPKEAALAVMGRGVMRPEELDPLWSESWFDDECRDVLCAVVALTEAGLERSALNLGKALYAAGYTFEQAADLATRATTEVVSRHELEPWPPWFRLLAQELGAA